MAKPNTALTPTALATKLSFAHLTGVAGPTNAAAAASAAARAAKGDADDPEPDDDKNKPTKDAKGSKAGADDDERKQKDGESDDEYSKRMKALDDRDKEEAAAAAAAAADSGDDPDAEDDDKDEEMRGKSAAAAARRREQARCAAIFACPAAARNIGLACSLAFETRMPRSEALAVLKSAPAAQAAGGQHAARGGGNPRLSAAGSTEMTGTQAVAQAWDAVLTKTKPATRR